jgi:ketosteroid isomerase-like protein
MAFTAETFAAFWAKPDLSIRSDDLSDDIVGYWPGTDEPVRGRDEYVGALKELLARVPDLTLTVAESAVDGEHLFIRWVAHATGANGPIEHTGVDRIKVVDGKVVENRIFFDRAAFERKLGVPLDL